MVSVFVTGRGVYWASQGKTG